VHTQLCIVSTKTISLDEEAYERLRDEKREGESFSDVVKRLAGERSWSEVVGVLDDDQADDLEAAIERGRGRSRDRSDRIASALEKTGAGDRESE